MNLNMLEAEKASKNTELRKGKSEYNPYENEEVDEFGNVSLFRIVTSKWICNVYWGTHPEL